MITLDYLARFPQFIEPLAVLHMAEWGWLRPHDTLAARVERLRLRCSGRSIPTAVIAHEKDELLGSALLVARDMDNRPRYTPWLSSVYVVKHRRGEGIGKMLVTRIETEAQAIGVRALHLYTPSAEAFYVPLGWNTIERIPYHGAEVAIMKKVFE